MARVLIHSRHCHFCSGSSLCSDFDVDDVFIILYTGSRRFGKLRDPLFTLAVALELLLSQDLAIHYETHVADPGGHIS